MGFNNITPLFTDLYEITMGAAYFAEGRAEDTATFSLFIRGFPPGRHYYVAAGIEEALTGLEKLQFSGADIKYLRTLDLFSNDFLACLENFRFTGDGWAMPEGTLFFPDEPILEISAPVIEAQVVETFLINALSLPILVASKAARCVHAARGRKLIDFALRRTHGMDAGMKVARSAYLAGFSGTSNVLAGKRYDIPVSGTMAHSFVTAFGDELAAFRAYAAVFPDQSVFLIDTYDTVKGAENAVIVAKEMAAEGHNLVGVRLDSGDMVELSKAVRSILDRAGLADVKIFASSSFDEVKIMDHLMQDARIDAFGVGTRLGVSADVPYVDIVYKMVQYKERPVRKYSEGKQTLAGEKQVFRKMDETGRMQEDIIGARNENIQNARPLLVHMVKNGKRQVPEASLEHIRSCFEENMNCFPGRYKSLSARDHYPVRISQILEAVQDKTRSE